jgi:uncharacterized repeat protein (TIGR01451 family)
VTSSQNPSSFNQSVTFTATVSPAAPGAGTPAGTVTFLDGGSPIGTGTLSGGVATFATSALAVGNHTITTSYGGDGNFNGSTGSLTGNPQVVTSIDLIVSKTHNPATYTANDVNDTITITVKNQGTTASTGTVTVTDTLPVGLTFNGSTTVGWLCNATGSNPVICSTTNVIASNGTSLVVLNVNVASSTATSLTNNVAVSCSCTESNTGNNTNFDIIPVTQTVSVTLDTRADLNATPKLMISGDGGATYFAAPHTFQWVPGSLHTIATTSPQTSGTQYGWVKWSDGGAISHSVMTPGSPATITADFAGPTALGGSYGVKSGTVGGQRVWTVNIGNNGPGVALGAEVTGMTIVQTSGQACNPTVLSTMPVVAGDIAPHATLGALVTIDFTGCFPNAFFKVTTAVSANNGAVTGTILRLNQLQ